MPGGSCTPVINPDILSCTRASTFCTASLIAAAIRSSSISRSSVTTCRLDLHAFDFVAAGHRDLHHASAGDSPSTSILAISACAFSHARLHRLRLLHQIAEISFHGNLAQDFKGRTVSGIRVAPKRSRRA